MLISTSSSNAGIGFAVPIDTVRVATNGIISTHRVENNVRPAPGLLGIGFFAVPIDTVRVATNEIISTHRVENNVRPAPGLLGIGLCSTRMKVTLFIAARKNIEFPGVYSFLLSK